MKLLQNVIERSLSNKNRLKCKWTSVIKDGIVVIYHYQHLVLRFDLDKGVSLYEWYETPTDKRGMTFAKTFLTERYETNKRVLGFD